MENLWSEDQHRKISNLGVGRFVNNDVLDCVYTTRLIGSTPELVLHGGGNTSVKTEITDTLGNLVDVICVKGSGWDMANIEPKGLPAIRLDPLIELQSVQRMEDSLMVDNIRSNLIDWRSPNPSVETLSHAFIPHKFVNHSHASAILSVTNQPNGEELSKEVFGNKYGIVPYVMPGFELAIKTLEIFNSNKNVDGLILLNHGIFTFSEDARTAYDNMIEAVSLAETAISVKKTFHFPGDYVLKNIEDVSVVAPILRGAMLEIDNDLNKPSGNDYRKLLFEFRSNDQVMEFVNSDDLDKYSRLGVATPDHVIRTKNSLLVLSAPEKGNVDQFKKEVRNSITKFCKEYIAYFERQTTIKNVDKEILDLLPQVIFVRGLGMFGVGRSRKDAVISADIAENFIEILKGAESIGTYVSLGESDAFDVEYWSLEQAKVKGYSHRVLDGNVVVVTGGGGTIGQAIVKEFKKHGAETIVLDLDIPDPTYGELKLRCDVTKHEDISSSFNEIVRTFGGLDIVISNAGGMFVGSMDSVSDNTFRQSFELNFFSHQYVSQKSFEIMRLQEVGGDILFNVSKQSVNPGTDAGPYGIPKAATLALMKQYAIEGGPYGVRSNAVNADRIRSGLLTQEMIDSRAMSRGVDKEKYLEQNLLGTEVTAEDVAKAFVMLAQSRSTSAAVITVDGGNIAASMR